MSRIRHVGVTLFAAMALVALTASVASAKSATVHLTVPSLGRSLEPGDFVEMRVDELSGEFAIEHSGAYHVECIDEGVAPLLGADLTDNARVDDVKLESSPFLFEGGAEGRCFGGMLLGIGGATVARLSDSHRVQPEGTFTVAKNLKAAYTPATTGVILEIESLETGAACGYGLKRLAGTATLAPQLRISFKDQKAKRVFSDTAEPAECPPKMTVSLKLSAWFAPEPQLEGERGHYEIAGSVS